MPTLRDADGEATSSRLLSSFALQQLRSAIPTRFVLADWALLYSTAVHGMSLNTFYMLTQGCGALVLAIKDSEGNVFGGFCSEWRMPSTPANFYGSGESFLFLVERVLGLPPLPVGDNPPPDEAVSKFAWTGGNSYFMFSHKEHLAMGSGGHFGLWLDEELLHGSSGPSETFGNPCLCRQPGSDEGAPVVGEFSCQVLEAWGVDHFAIARHRQDRDLRGVRL